jgi:hypothetical protein
MVMAIQLAIAQDDVAPTACPTGIFDFTSYLRFSTPDKPNGRGIEEYLDIRAP